MKITELSGVGAKTADKLAGLNIITVLDLLLWLPIKYLDKTKITPIGCLRFDDHAVIEGVIQNINGARGRAPLNFTLADATGSVQITFFRTGYGQHQNITPGTKLRCFGAIKYYQGKICLYHPEYKVVTDTLPVEETLSPIYRLKDGITQQLLRRHIQAALELGPSVNIYEDLLPESILNSLELPSMYASLNWLHNPATGSDLELIKQGKYCYQQRLIIEELVAHRLGMQWQKKQSAKSYKLTDITIANKFIASLKFKLTGAQQKVCQEIVADVAQATAMRRLLQGDVGSGKTVIAMYSALLAVADEKQVAIMVPTEILAEQHFKSFTTSLTNFPVKVVLLTGSVTAKEKKLIKADLAEGKINILIGTHAIYQKDCIFNNLALVIIDEQHRFGVHQRLALQSKGKNNLAPHYLIMTATPIPRTLAMVFYRDLEISIIDELPPGRKPIVTTVMADTKRDELCQRVQEKVSKGSQVYWVCPLIEDSEKITLNALENIYTEVKAKLTNVRLAIIHGKLSQSSKDELMRDFAAGNIDILLATTVIEVGVNVQNASLMIIENADRFGLAQLHQLRGRVGRGSTQSYCVLLYKSPLSLKAKSRLEALRSSQDGFYLAEEDLRLRGQGEILGARQTGFANMRVANLIRDSYLLPVVDECIQKLGDNQDVKLKLKNRWLKESECSKV